MLTCPACSRATLSMRDKALAAVPVRIRCRGCGAALRISPWWRVVMVVFSATTLLAAAILALDFGSVIPIFVGLIVAFVAGALPPLGVNQRDPMTQRALAKHGGDPLP
jgi:hypothetical protein